MHIYTFTPVKHIHVHCEVLKNASERYQNRCRERYKPVPARGTSVQRLSVVPDWPHPGLTTTAA